MRLNELNDAQRLGRQKTGDPLIDVLHEADDSILGAWRIIKGQDHDESWKAEARDHLQKASDLVRRVLLEVEL